MEKIEIEVKKWHHDPPQYKDLKDNVNKRALGVSCKKPNNDKKCKDNEVENAQGKCEGCKKGMRFKVLSLLGTSNVSELHTNITPLQERSRTRLTRNVSWTSAPAVRFLTD